MAEIIKVIGGLGDATENDVLAGKTFSSESGIRKVGVGEKPEGLYVWKKYELGEISVTQQNSGSSPIQFKLASDYIDLSKVTVDCLVGKSIKDDSGVLFIVDSTNATYTLTSSGTVNTYTIEYDSTTQILELSGSAWSKIHTFEPFEGTAFIDYVVSGDESKYPDGEKHTDGYYYKKVLKVSTESEEKTVTPTINDLVITPSSNDRFLSSVTIKGDADLLPDNIKKGVDIFGVVGTLGGIIPKQFTKASAGSFTLSTSTSQPKITHGLGVTPKMIIFWIPALSNDVTKTKLGIYYKSGIYSFKAIFGNSTSNMGPILTSFGTVDEETFQARYFSSAYTFVTSEPYYWMAFA